jgi:pyrimidine operon attenuation protein/uracil phosphoribosyltransferase
MGGLNGSSFDDARMPDAVIMDPRQVRRTIARLAREIVERNRDTTHLMFFGIRERGEVIAEAIASEVQRVVGLSLPLHSLDISSFRDDAPPEERTPPDASSIDVSDRDVVLVDDVLFTGRTVRAALDMIVHLGRPRTIQLVTLVDRGHREYPVQPDYVGRVIPTKYGERIVVDTKPAVVVRLEE